MKYNYNIIIMDNQSQNTIKLKETGGGIDREKTGCPRVLTRIRYMAIDNWMDKDNWMDDTKVN